MSLELSKKALAIKPSSTMEITEKAKMLKQEGRDIISFAPGEPDFATPENICRAAKQAIDQGLTKYTAASGLLELKEAVCEKFRSFNHLHYTPDQIVISSGGKHSLYVACMAILNEGDEVILPAPCWVSYSEMAKLAGAVTVILPTLKENGYKVTAEELEAAVTERTKALILNSPNNPTGTIYTREELEQIAAFAVRHDIYVIADEVYEALCYEGNAHVSIASLNEEIYQRTITVSAMSKTYAMTGWRIGYTGAPSAIAKLMGSIQSQQTSNPNTIAQMAAIEALRGDQGRVQEMITAYDERRRYVCDRLSAIRDLSFVRPLGAFYVFADVTAFLGKECKGRRLATGADIAAALLDEKGVAVIPCGDFGYPDHIRISYSTDMETIKKGMERIIAFFSELAE